MDARGTVTAEEGDRYPLGPPPGFDGEALTAINNIMECKKCKTYHDGTYGSGTFCSMKCARGFASQMRQSKNSYGIFICKFCSIEKQTKTSIIGHQVRCPNNPERKVSKGNTGKTAWNRGKTKETDNIMRQISTKLTGRPGTPHTDVTRAILKEKMILAHKEGRAWNIGMNRWKKKPSYAEDFFMRCVNDKFQDKNFQREVYFHGFVLDFLWHHKKKVIEVDGKQHEEPTQKERDIRKDALLRQNGYEIMRIKWKDMCADPLLWISKSKSFIDE